MPTPNIAEVLRAVHSALKPLKIRWYVFGAQAVIAAGAVRQTADLDITTDDVPADVLRRALSKAGFRLRDDIAGIKELIEHHRILPLVHRTSGYQLDVVRAGPGPEQQMLERVIVRTIGRSKIPFVSTNDLLVLKTLAGRDKDLEDIRTLLSTGSAEIDVAIVRARLRELGALIDDSSLLALFERQLRAARPTLKSSPRARSPKR